MARRLEGPDLVRSLPRAEAMEELERFLLARAKRGTVSPPRISGSVPPTGMAIPPGGWPEEGIRGFRAYGLGGDLDDPLTAVGEATDGGLRGRFLGPELGRMRTGAIGSSPNSRSGTAASRTSGSRDAPSSTDGSTSPSTSPAGPIAPRGGGRSSSRPGAPGRRSPASTGPSGTPRPGGLDDPSGNGPAPAHSPARVRAVRMAPQPPPLSAPDLIGVRGVLGPAASGPRGPRRARARPYRFARLEVELSGGLPTAGPPVPGLEALESLLKERKVAEPDGLASLAARALHALRARGVRRVDHWEIAPGGWLPLPDAAGAGGADAASDDDLLTALEQARRRASAPARSFSARLSGDGQRVDLVVRRVHRERTPAVTLELRGEWTKGSIDELRGALAARLPVGRITMTRFTYA